MEILKQNRVNLNENIQSIPHHLLDSDIVSGQWTVKDIISHLTYYEQWFADRIHEQLNSIPYTPAKYDKMHWGERNLLVYGDTKDLSYKKYYLAPRKLFSN